MLKNIKNHVSLQNCRLYGGLIPYYISVRSPEKRIICRIIVRANIRRYHEKIRRKEFLTREDGEICPGGQKNLPAGVERFDRGQKKLTTRA